jgi:hypothetical protein
VVLDRIISSSWKVLGDLSPSVPDSFVVQKQDPFFFIRPSTFLDLRIQVIMPSMT